MLKMTSHRTTAKQPTQYRHRFVALFLALSLGLGATSTPAQDIPFELNSSRTVRPDVSRINSWQRDDYRDSNRDDYRSSTPSRRDRTRPRQTNERDTWRQRGRDNRFNTRPDTSGWNNNRDTSGWNDNRGTSDWSNDRGTPGWNNDRDTSPVQPILFERWRGRGTPDADTYGPVVPNFPTTPIRQTPVTPTTPNRDTERATIQARISQRYRNPLIVRFAQTLTAERALAMFNEISQLIDSRHLQPKPYEERTAQAVQNLMQALDNADFLTASRANPSRDAIAGFRQTLTQLETGRGVQTAADAANALRWTMDVASQTLGLAPGCVVTEFIYGATETLDPYSTFIPPANATGPKAALEDHVVGIGVSVEADERGVVIVKILPGSPAQSSGLAKGDLIVGVNGQSLEGRSLDFIVDLITGPEGSSLRLDVVRGQGWPQDITLVRRTIPLSTVSDVQIIDATTQTAYMKLEQFGATSADEIDKALWNLHRQGMQALILDLRGNPGGFLTSAIDISNKFVSSGTIVSTRGRTSADNMQEVAQYSQTWKVPLVILIDKNSASASEILAAAIQENNRGIVVGQRSYGKGTVQTQFNLQSVAAGLRLTTAKFYSPNGREMAEKGVEPDVLVSETTSRNFNFQDDAVLQRAIAVAGSRQLKDIAATKSRPNTQQQPQQQRYQYLIPS